MVLQWRRISKAASVVAVLVYAFNLTMLAVPPAAEKPLAGPLRPTVAEASRAAVCTCCSVPSPAGGVCMLDFPSIGNRPSRSGSVGAELPLSNDGHPPELGPKGTLHSGPDEFIRFTVAYHAELIAAMEEMKSDMEEIKSEMQKIMSGLRRHAGEFKDLKDEVAYQGTIQRRVISVVMISTMAFGIFVWENYDKWMKRLYALVMVWAGEALYEFTGGWFGKKVS